MNAITITKTGSQWGNLSSTETLESNQAFLNTNNYFYVPIANNSEGAWSVGEKMVDYIVSETTANGFKVIKWASGWTEYFKTLSYSGTCNTYQKWYIDKENTPAGAYPSNFKSWPGWMCGARGYLCGTPRCSTISGSSSGPMWSVARSQEGSVSCVVDITWKGYI